MQDAFEKLFGNQNKNDEELKMEAVSGFMHMIHEEKNDITNIPLLRENDTYLYDSSQYQVRRSSEVSVDCLI